MAAACAQALAGEHEVFVITCAPFAGWQSFAGKWEQLKLMRIFRFTPLNLFTIFNIARYSAILRLFWHLIDMVNPHTYFVVRRILLSEKPDLILTHNLKGLGYSVHLAIHHSRFIKQFVKQHSRWLHTIHDMGALHPTGLKIWGREKSIFQKNPLVSLYARINRKLLGDPDVVISPSQFLLDEYRIRGFFPQSLTAVVRNPVLTEVAEVTKEPEAARGSSATSGSSDSSVTFLYVGQLEEYKGVRLLLDVWKDFSAQHSNVMLSIVGDGSLKNEVTRLSQQLGRVKYYGFIPHEQLGVIFSGAHFVLIPSLAYENSPTIIGESFTAGIPVIASRIGGIPELVEHRHSGFLFNPGDRRDLLKVMEEALKSKWADLSCGAEESSAVFSLQQYSTTLDSLFKL